MCSTCIYIYLNVQCCFVQEHSSRVDMDVLQSEELMLKVTERDNVQLILLYVYMVLCQV